MQKYAFTKAVSGLLPTIGLTLYVTSSYAGALEGVGHIHGIEYGGAERQTLILGAHQGLFRFDQAVPERLSAESFDVMGLAPGKETGVFYASGHPQGGGNTGLLRSVDGGKTFSQVSAGLDGPVDFHHLAVSATDPSVIYGVHQGLQVSRDGGDTWSKQGSLPPKLLQLAASARSADRLYAASEQGLYASDDAGNNWQELFPLPATSVVATNGRIYAFVVGKGLIQTQEEDALDALQWREVHNRFGAQVLLDVAISVDGQRLAGLTQYGTLLESRDQGQNWRFLPAKPQPDTAQARAGKDLYADNCQTCHGIQAVGETYTVEGLTTQDYLFAPALNGSMHAWHHTDEQLLQTIMEGSPRTSRMPAWKTQLSEADAKAVIAYLKTLWGEPQKRCQGPRHMDRTCLQGG